MKTWIFICLIVFSFPLYGEGASNIGIETLTLKSNIMGESIFGQVQKLFRKLEKALKQEQLFRQAEFEQLKGLIKSNDIKLARRMLEDYHLRGKKGGKVRKTIKRLRKRLNALAEEESQQPPLVDENCPGSGLDEVAFFSTSRAFAALKPSGLVITWGGSDFGGDSGEVAEQINCGVIDIIANKSAFAALKADGTVVTWGDVSAGGDSSSVSGQLNNVSKVYATDRAFAAVKNDGSVVPWGDPSYGGEAAIRTSDHRGDNEKRFPLHTSMLDGTTGRVLKIASTESAFAAIVEDTKDSTRKFVIAWGNGRMGGDLVSHRDDPYLYGDMLSHYIAPLLENGVVDIFGKRASFAALKENGSVVAWGMDDYYGRDWASVASDLQSGVAKIFSDDWTFVALKEDGSVVVWGLDTTLNTVPLSNLELLSGGVVDVVVSDMGGFVAIKDDGRIVVWGGDGDQHVPASDSPQNFVKLLGGDPGFAGVKQDGTVVSWGHYEVDGVWGPEYFLHPIIDIFSNGHAFAALMDNGAVFTWGWDESGGFSDEDYMGFLNALDKEYEKLSDKFYESTGNYPNEQEDIDRLHVEAVKRSIHHLYQVKSGAVKIASTDAAFVTLKEDGTIVTWGAEGYGADSSSVASLFGK